MTVVLVIGANGMLGREVVRSAAAHAEVVCAGRSPREGWIVFDGTHDTLGALFARHLDLVVNCAAVLASDIDRDDPESVAVAERVNSEFPLELAAAAGAAGARLVHISTDAVFADDAGLCFEDDRRFGTDVYATTKRLGEPDAPGALTLRCSFVGSDPTRRRGLLEWLLAQPDGASVDGFVDQLWNGLASTQVAGVCAALLESAVFNAARAEGPVHHLFEDPPLTKYELLERCAETFGRRIDVTAADSGHPVTRVLGAKHVVLRQCLESLPSRAMSLARLAERGEGRDG
jgi:dTDP-4-dehydrorhamnose reductase